MKRGLTLLPPLPVQLRAGARADGPPAQAVPRKLGSAQGQVSLHCGHSASSPHQGAVRLCRDPSWGWRRPRPGTCSHPLPGGRQPRPGSGIGALAAAGRRGDEGRQPGGPDCLSPAAGPGPAGTREAGASWLCRSQSPKTRQPSPEQVRPPRGCPGSQASGAEGRAQDTDLFLGASRAWETAGSSQGQRGLRTQGSSCPESPDSGSHCERATPARPFDRQCGRPGALHTGSRPTAGPVRLQVAVPEDPSQNGQTSLRGGRADTRWRPHHPDLDTTTQSRLPSVILGPVCHLPSHPGATSAAGLIMLSLRGSMCWQVQPWSPVSPVTGQ